MKSFSFLIAVGLIAISGSLANAQQKTNVCIIDLATVFKSHPTFNQQLEQLQKDAESFKAQIAQQRQSLTSRRDAMLKLPPESAQYKSEESNLAQLAARLEVDARNKIKEFGKREADLHFMTYQQIQGLISKYCRDRGIRIVLAFSDVQVDQKNPDSIMRWVNNSIVYHAPHKDITKPIIQYLAQVTANSNSK